jgi:drug/metabolite transporter (DMT)-like permease
MILCTLLMLPLYWWRRRLTPVNPRHWWKLIGFGALGVGLNQFFFVVGIARTSVTHAALILPLTPLLTLGMARALGLEKITPRKMFGMAIAFSGVLVLQLSKGPARGATLFGDLLLFLGILSFASYIVLGKRATSSYDGVVVNTIAFAASAVMLLPVTLWQIQGFDFSRVTSTGWGSFLYMVAFSSILGYMLYYYVLKHLEPSRISAFSYIQPVMTTSLAAVLLGEPVTISLVGAGALILLGVWVTERAP